MKSVGVQPWRIVATAVGLLVLSLGAGHVRAEPEVRSSKTGDLIRDADRDLQPDPGDEIRYTVTIGNSGNTTAQGITFTDTIDQSTSLVAGSVTTTPLALNDNYAATGNVRIGVSAPGVLANDVDPDGGAITAVPISGGSSANGGDVILAADGKFTYDPPPGFEGVDSFTYTIEDSDGNTDSATVVIAVTDMIWFVDAGATCPCDGRRTSPFDDVAVTANSFDVNAVDAAGDNIFVAAGAYNGGLTLLNNQKLIGDGSSSDLATVAGITLAPDSVTIGPFSGTDPLLTSSGHNLTVGQNNTIRGLTVGNSGGIGIRGSAVGTLTVSEASIGGTGGAINRHKR